MENQGFFSQMLKRGMSSEETHVTILVKKKDVNVDFVLGYVYGSLSKAADSLHVRMDARARTHLLQQLVEWVGTCSQSAFGIMLPSRR
jgi:hypothetical protein